MSKFLLFSKIFGDRSPTEVAAYIADLGLHGVDLLVRDGYRFTGGL